MLRHLLNTQQVYFHVCSKFHHRVETHCLVRLYFVSCVVYFGGNFWGWKFFERLLKSMPSAQDFIYVDSVWFDLWFGLLLHGMHSSQSHVVAMFIYYLFIYYGLVLGTFMHLEHVFWFVGDHSKHWKSRIYQWPLCDVALRFVSIYLFGLFRVLGTFDFFATILIFFWLCVRHCLC